MYAWLLFVIAILLLALVPFVPQVVRLRIRVFRWLHWNWAATLLESHFPTWVLLKRIALLVIAAVLLYFGWTQ